MLRLSKKVEYAILALQYIASRTEKASAREISEYLNISFDFLSKTMQQLMKKGIIASQKGVNGGYYLSKKSDEINIADVIDALEENSTIANCLEDEEDCKRQDDCTIKHNVEELQNELRNVLTKMTIADMASSMKIENN